MLVKTGVGKSVSDRASDAFLQRLRCPCCARKRGYRVARSQSDCPNFSYLLHTTRSVAHLPVPAKGLRVLRFFIPDPLPFKEEQFKTPGAEIHLGQPYLRAGKNCSGHHARNSTDSRQRPGKIREIVNCERNGEPAQVKGRGDSKSNMTSRPAESPGNSRQYAMPA
jgi:hypothetical protein